MFPPQLRKNDPVEAYEQKQPVYQDDMLITTMETELTSTKVRLNARSENHKICESGIIKSDLLLT